jgi:hypothetical protein
VPGWPCPPGNALQQPVCGDFQGRPPYRSCSATVPRRRHLEEEGVAPATVGVSQPLRPPHIALACVRIHRPRVERT